MSTKGPASTTPADPAAYRPRGRGPGLALFVLFGLGCAILGALLALGGARLIAARPQPPAAIEAAARPAPPAAAPCRPLRRRRLGPPRRLLTPDSSTPSPGA